MPRILFIVNNDSFFLSHRLPLAINAQKEGFEVHILTGLSNESNDIYNYQFNIYKLNIRKTSINPLSFINSFLRVVRVLINVKPDVLHLITSKPMIWGGLASKIFKPKVVVSSVTGLGQVYAGKRLSSFLRPKP